MKTKEQVEKLKQNWIKDPCWDIYESKGFEDYRDELFKYQQRIEKAQEELHLEKLNYKANELGISGNIRLAQYIINLETRISNLTDNIERVRGQLHSR